MMPTTERIIPVKLWYKFKKKQALMPNRILDLEWADFMS